MKRTPLPALAFALVVPCLATAANITLQTTGDFGTPATWAGSVVPGAGDNAQIDQGNTATHSTGTTTVDSLRLGANNGTSANGLTGTGTLDVSGGTITFNVGDPYRDSNGKVNVNGGTVNQIGGNTRMAHRNGGTDTINVTSGSFTNISRTSGEHGAWSLNVSGGVATYEGSHFDAAVNPDSGGDLDNDTFGINLSGGSLTFSPTNNVRLGTRAGSTRASTRPEVASSPSPRPTRPRWNLPAMPPRPSAGRYRAARSTPTTV